MNDNLLDIFECDINDLSKLSEQLPHDYDTFYHFAWDGTYGASRDDVMLQEANVKTH